MTDIIANAQKLLDGATPAPWKVYAWERHPDSDVYVAGHDLAPVTGDGWIEPADGVLIAAAPELAQALAEETYEYIVQVECGGRWQFYIGESIRPTDKPGLATGFSKLEHALEFSKMETKRPTRIVRRRVSPVEEIE